MQQEGKGEIVSSPRVITSDQNEATIKQGVQIPYQEATSSGATSVSFKDAVLELTVTPHITPDDRIIMDLNVNKDNPDFTRAVLGVPPVDTRELETSVLVDNGETVVLGGVFERTKSRNIGRVSVLRRSAVPRLHVQTGTDPGRKQRVADLRDAEDSQGYADTALAILQMGPGCPGGDSRG